MADIVKLDWLDQPRRSRARAGRPTQPCEIVIFPGVRYERWVEEQTPPAPTPAPKRRRRRGE